MRPFPFKSITYIVLSLLLIACLDQIELQPVKGLEKGVTVQGELIKGTPSVVKVKVNRLFNFDLKASAPVEVESVALVDEKEQEILIPLRLRDFYQYTFKQ